MTDLIAKMVSVAEALALLQTANPMAEDETGFSNADINVGAHLARIVASNPENEENVQALAALLRKYRRQVEAMTNADTVAAIVALAKGKNLSTDARAAARWTVVARPNVHPQYGAQVLFSFQYNEAIAFALKQHGGKAFFQDGGFLWAVRADKVADAVAAMKHEGATVVGSCELPEGVAPAAKTNVIRGNVIGKEVHLAFDYNVEFVKCIKDLPRRRMAKWETKTWAVPVADLAIVCEALEHVGANVDELRALSPQVPDLVAPVIVEPEVQVDTKYLASAFPHQKEGVEFLCQSLAAIRNAVGYGGASVRGLILGDDMGLGKTYQTIVAAHSLAQPGERILVVCPASLKLNWTREIVKWLGDDAGTVNIVNGKAFDYNARWNVINYDILAKHYDTLERAGFAILICDEAHAIKNRESNRSRLIVGGKKVPLPQVPTEKDPRTKAPRDIQGLASLATRRVFMLTGTPITNRVRDLFNLLKATGHPLGKTWFQFGQRYCAPTVNQFGTVYNGSSNIEELRRRVDPVFIQRKKEDFADVLSLPGKGRTWNAVEVDISLYLAIMDEYAEKRRLGLLTSTQHHLALITEARNAAAVAKVPATVDLVNDMVEGGEKVIVFTNWTRSLELLEKQFGAQCVVFHGGMSATQKDNAVTAFQTNDNVRIFVANLKAGGVGLNLTAATQVVFNDLTWTPADHRQGEDRSNRIGQKRFVTATYVLAAGTFDEDLAVMLKDKLDTINTFENTDEDLFPMLLERLAQAPRNASVRNIIKRGGNRSRLGRAS